MKNNFSSLGSMMERRLIRQQAAPRSGPGPQDGGDIVVQREQDPQLQRDIDQAARRERLTRETEAIGQVKATETGKVVEAIQSDDLAKTKDATVRYFQMLTDAGADINSAFKAVKDAMSVAGKPELAAHLSVAAGALVFADAPRTPAVEAPAAPQPAAGEAPAQPETQQPAPDPLAGMEDEDYLVADEMLKSLPPNLQNSLVPTVRKLVEDDTQQAACESAITFLKALPAGQQEVALRLLADPSAMEIAKQDPQMKATAEFIESNVTDANVQRVLTDLGAAIITASATPERGVIAPGDRLAMEQNADAALGKIDFTKISGAEKEMQIAQIMMAQGVNVTEKDGKMVATAPNSQMDKIINHISGVMMWVTALGEKMKGVKEGVKGKPEDAKAGPTKGPESAEAAPADTVVHKRVMDAIQTNGNARNEWQTTVMTHEAALPIKQQEAQLAQAQVQPQEQQVVALKAQRDAASAADKPGFDARIRQAETRLESLRTDAKSKQEVVTNTQTALQTAKENIAVLDSMETQRDEIRNKMNVARTVLGTATSAPLQRLFALMQTAKVHTGPWVENVTDGYVYTDLLTQLALATDEPANGANVGTDAKSYLKNPTGFLSVLDKAIAKAQAEVTTPVAP